VTTDRNGIVDIFLVIVWRVMIYVRVIVDSQYMYLVDLFIPFLCNIIVCTTETSIPVCVSSGSCNNARMLEYLYDVQMYEYMYRSELVRAYYAGLDFERMA